MASVESGAKSLDSPEETRPCGHGSMAIVHVGDATFGRDTPNAISAASPSPLRIRSCAANRAVAAVRTLDDRRRDGAPDELTDDWPRRPCRGSRLDRVQVMAIFDVPQRFSRQWVARKVP